ncbi:hypothetical protein SELR_11400 [Selenomonas ruminantium subsp. lactilytica TAM6421]|uniref:Uncharacterized protein n=2 Tax=Selenomonas ruminantium TaxID=971 RepID=I0GQ11_SELRL|nr:hypothetical protein SELR_11400 [Selenomonas ruminantium subsp. lactilytica TAM6421]
MRPVRVRSVSLGAVVDEKGRSLRMIGRLPVNEGDTVWTDGRIVYGHVPVRPSIKPMFYTGEIPVKSQSGLNGYVLERNGVYHDYDLNMENDLRQSFILNNDKKIFECPLEATSIYYLNLDAEICQDDENSWFIGGVDSKQPQVIWNYVSFDGTNFTSSFIPTNVQIYVNKIINERIQIHKCKIIDNASLELIASELRNVCNAGEFDYIIAQVLDFRFVDRQGNWDAVVAFSLKGTLLREPSQKTYMSEEAKGGDYYGGLTIGEPVFVGKRGIAGGLAYFVYDQTCTTTATVETVEKQNADFEIPLENALFIVKIKSNGGTTLLQKRIEMGANDVSYNTTGTIEWVNMDSPIYNYIFEYPTRGTVTYQGGIVAPQNADPADVAEGLYGAVLHGDIVESNMLRPVEALTTVTEHIDAETIGSTVPFGISLNEGYSAITNIFSLFDIQKDNESIIMNRLDGLYDAYYVKPAPRSNYINLRNGDGWDVIREYSNGTTETAHTNDYPGYYVSGSLNGFTITEPRYHFIPHICLCNLRRGYIYSHRGDMWHDGEIAVIQGNRKKVLGTHSQNLRLSVMKKVKPIIRRGRRWLN